MISDEILATSFVTAHFINSERTQIEILTLEAPDSSNQISTVIEYDTNHPWCQSLLKVCDLDMLHENTWAKINREKLAFEQTVLKIVKDQGLVYEPNKSESKFHQSMLNFLFDYNDKEQKEDLFSVKLASFELEKVKNCTDDLIKSKIRKAQTPLEVVQVISEIK